MGDVRGAGGGRARRAQGCVKVGLRRNDVPARPGIRLARAVVRFDGPERRGGLGDRGGTLSPVIDLIGPRAATDVGNGPARGAVVLVIDHGAGGRIVDRALVGGVVDQRGPVLEVLDLGAVLVAADGFLRAGRLALADDAQQIVRSAIGQLDIDALPPRQRGCDRTLHGTRPDRNSGGGGRDAIHRPLQRVVAVGELVERLVAKRIQHGGALRVGQLAEGRLGGGRSQVVGGPGYGVGAGNVVVIRALDEELAEDPAVPVPRLGQGDVHRIVF